MQLNERDHEKNDGLICPITGDLIKFDNAGQIQKLSLSKLRADLRD